LLPRSLPFTIHDRVPHSRGKPIASGVRSRNERAERALHRLFGAACAEIAAVKPDGTIIGITLLG
jgi:hypothetical protein